VHRALLRCPVELVLCVPQRVALVGRRRCKKGAVGASKSVLCEMRGARGGVLRRRGRNNVGRAGKLLKWPRGIAQEAARGAPPAHRITHRRGPRRGRLPACGCGPRRCSCWGPCSPGGTRRR
jgi:hypothetical protein